jgi:hypothetical protein
MSIKSILNPGMYHGFDKKPPFFEGWYYKLISADEKHKVAFIPGVILGKDVHSFVQVMDGVDGSTSYYNFPYQQFTADHLRFAIKIGENVFDDKLVSLNIDQPEGQIKGEIHLGPLSPWPVTFISPGIMGIFAWIPGMECYHGVLSFNHSIRGTLNLNGKKMNFDGGRGYIEKDWGKSFPSAWIWFQSNHFAGVSACITASVAIIPWIRRAFRGFIVGLWLDGKLYRFATYNGSKIESLEIFSDHVEWVLRNNRYRLCLSAKRVHGGLLRGPTRLDMGQRVLETLNATVHVKLETIHGNHVFEGDGAHTGLEVMGDIPSLLAEK